MFVATGEETPDHSRFILLSPASREFSVDWDLAILVCTTEAGSRSEEAPALLGSWSAEPAPGR